MTLFAFIHFFYIIIMFFFLFIGGYWRWDGYGSQSSSCDLKYGVSKHQNKKSLKKLVDNLTYVVCLCLYLSVVDLCSFILLP